VFHKSVRTCLRYDWRLTGRPEGLRYD